MVSSATEGQGAFADIERLQAGIAARHQYQDAQARTIGSAIARRVEVLAPEGNAEPISETPSNVLFRQALRHVTRTRNDADLPTVKEAILRRKQTSLDRAQEFLAKNWSVFPAKVGEKKPAVDAYTPFCKRLASREDLEAWSRIDDWCELAVALGPASAPLGYWLVALDLDSDEIAKEWESQAGSLENYYVVRPRRGLHVYFLLPADAVPGNCLKLYVDGESIGELRLHGVYIMAPGTLHMNSAPGASILYRPDRESLPNVYDLPVVRDIGKFLGEKIRGGTVTANPGKTKLRSALGVDVDTPPQSAFSIEVGGRVDERRGVLPPGEERFRRTGSLSKRSLANEEDILWWLEQTTPKEKGNRDNQVWDACRHVKFFSDGYLIDDDPDILDDLAARWHAYAAKRKALSREHSEDDTIDAFHRAYGRVEVPADAGNFVRAMERARTMDDPPCFEARRRRFPRGFHPSAVLAYKLMHVLQDLRWSSEPEPFYISHQRLADFLGVRRPTITSKIDRWKRYRFIEVATDWFPNGQTFVRGKWSTRYWYKCTCFNR